MKAIRRQSLSEQVVESILNYIKDKDMKPGEQIPTESEFSEFFQVSRTSIREAMKALSMNGVILSIPGKGTFLQPKAMDTFIGQDGVLKMKARATIKEIMEIRTPLEVLAIKLAAERGTEKEFEELEKICTEYVNAVEAKRDWMQWGARFHAAIAEMTKNQLLISSLRLLGDSVQQYREQLAICYGTNIYYIESHKIICRALREGDVEKATEEMFHHMKVTEASLNKLVDENSTGSTFCFKDTEMFEDIESK